MTWSRAARSASLRAMSRIVRIAALTSAFVASCAARTDATRDLDATPDRTPAHATAEAPDETPTTAPGVRDEAASDDATPPRDLGLPFGWDTIPTAAFEDVLARWNPGRVPARLGPEATGQLGAALDGETERALRAALLLAHSADPAAWSVLLARLERRVRPSTDAFPALDVTVAASLARSVGRGSDARATALSELARGRRPHPLLVVRAECAASALALSGSSADAAFLLALLREGTSAQDVTPPWTRGATSFEDVDFAQWRAASALALAAGVPVAYRPESSAVERARAAAELERALAARPPNGGS